MMGAALIVITLVPVLCTLLLGGKMPARSDNPVMRPLWLYRPVIRWVLDTGTYHRGRSPVVAVPLALSRGSGRSSCRRWTRAPALHAGHRPGDLDPAGHAIIQQQNAHQGVSRRWPSSWRRSAGPRPPPTRRR